MKENFLKHFITIGAGTFISMAIGFFTTPIITRIVDPNEYGKFSIFTLYGNITLMFFCLGLDQALVRFFYENDSIEFKRGLLKKCVSLPFVVSLLAGIITVTLGVSGIWKFELGESALLLLAVFTVTEVVYRFSQLLIRLQYKTKLYSLLNVIQKATYVLLALIGLRYTSYSDEMILIVATVCAALVCLFTSIADERSFWRFNLVKDSDCSITKKELILYAYPYIFSMGLNTLFQSIDKFSLNLYGSYSDVGIYSSTMTLVNIIAIIQTTFNSLWSPMAVEHYSKDKNDKTFYQNGNQAITVIMFFVGITLMLCKDIFALLLGSKYRMAAYILPFLIFNPIMYTISETTVSGLVFMKKSKYQIWVSAIACATNLIGNTLLVPKYGCQGAAISTGISYIIFFTARTYFSNKFYYIDFSLKKFYLLTVVTVAYAFYNTFYKFGIGSVAGYLICLTIYIFLYHESIKKVIRYVKRSIVRKD